MRPARTHLPTWIALLACALLVGMPARGLTLCSHSDGGFGIGVATEHSCPCPTDRADTPPCKDLSIDAVRDLATPGPAVHNLVRGAAIAGARLRSEDTGHRPELVGSRVEREDGAGAPAAPQRFEASSTRSPADPTSMRAGTAPERRLSSSGAVARLRAQSARRCVVLLI